MAELLVPPGEPTPHADDALEAPVGPADLAPFEAGLADVRRSPSDHGRVELLVARPGPRQRTTPPRATLSVQEGLEGDDWSTRPCRRSSDGGPHPDMQVAMINSRLLELVAGGREHWPLAGDQLVVDLDLAADNLETGRRLRVGTAEVEVTAQPHTGCRKFAERFGRDALRLVSTPEARRQRLRGIYVRVVSPGMVGVGDRVSKLGP